MTEPRDEHDLISEIEEADLEAAVQRRLKARSQEENRSLEDFRRTFVWCLEGESVANVGLRLYIAAAKLGIDCGRGKSYQQLAATMGFRRQAAHNLGNQFTAIFGIRGTHDRNETTRTKYARSYATRTDRGNNVIQNQPTGARPTVAA